MSEQAETQYNPQEGKIREAIRGLKDLKDYLSVVKHVVEFEVESYGHGAAVQDAVYAMMGFMPIDKCILSLEEILKDSEDVRQ